jgi:cell division protein FtsB
MINENKKLQSELRQINDKLGSENKISMKSLEENLSKLEGELSKVKKENTILRDEVEDLQD